MPVLEFVGQSSQDSDNIGANTSRLLNLYREGVQGRSTRVLKSVLGTEAFSALDGVFLRAMKTVAGTLYVVLGGVLYRVSSDGETETLSSLPDSKTTTISGNNGRIAINADGEYFVHFQGDTTKIDDAYLTGISTDEEVYGLASDAPVSDVVFIGQRTVIIYADRRVQWSDPIEADKLNALNFATTESRDDNNLRAVNIDGVLWILKEQSIERWAQTADGLRAIPNYTIDRGLKAHGLLADVPQGVFFVGDDNRAYVGAGQGLGAPISNRAVETAITEGDPTNCLYYADEGHEFYVIRFSDRPAWCYDLATGEWHERSEGADFGPWTAIEAARAYGSFFVGSLTGGVRRLVRSNADADQPLFRRAVSNSLRVEGQKFKTRQIEFLGRVGRSLLDSVSPASSGDLFFAEVPLFFEGEVPPFTTMGASREPTVSLRVSRDYGLTWGHPKERSFGALGDYDNRIMFRSLGVGRSLTVDVTITDPAELTLDADATVQIA